MQTFRDCSSHCSRMYSCKGQTIGRFDLKTALESRSWNPKKGAFSGYNLLSKCYGKPVGRVRGPKCPNVLYCAVYPFWIMIIYNTFDATDIENQPCFRYMA